MKKRAVILVGLAGLTVGVIGTLATILATGQTIGGYGLGISDRDTDKTVARVLTGRLAQSFVGAEKFHEKGRLEAVSFYDTPTPTGRNLCRVNRYSFTGLMVAGRRTAPDHEGAGGMTMSVGYAVAPGAGGAADRKDVCARYREFSRLISVSHYENDGSIGDEETVDRIIELLRQAKIPGMEFASVCRGSDGPCDARKELANLDPRRIVLVSGGRLHAEGAGYSRTDFMIVCRDDASGCQGRPMNISIESRYLSGERPPNQSRLKSVDIDQAPITL